METEEKSCLAGAIICFVFGLIMLVLGDILTAITWVVGIVWAFIASRYAKQVAKLQSDKKCLIDEMIQNADQSQHG